LENREDSEEELGEIEDESMMMAKSTPLPGSDKLIGAGDGDKTGLAMSSPRSEVGS